MASQVARSAIKQGVAISSAVRPASIFASSVRNYSSSPSTPPQPSPIASTSEPTGSVSASAHRPTPTPQPTNLPGSNLPAAHPTRYSPLTVSVVTKLAKLFGYHSQTSTAIRTTSDYYDRCAERGEIEAPFWYEGELSFPRSQLRGRPYSHVHKFDRVLSTTFVSNLVLDYDSSRLAPLRSIPFPP